MSSLYKVITEGNMDRLVLVIYFINVIHAQAHTYTVSMCQVMNVSVCDFVWVCFKMTKQVFDEGFSGNVISAVNHVCVLPFSHMRTTVQMIECKIDTHKYCLSSVQDRVMNGLVIFKCLENLALCWPGLNLVCILPCIDLILRLTGFIPIPFKDYFN